jgi:lipid-binding SYLF domain-containing protein
MMIVQHTTQNNTTQITLCALGIYSSTANDVLEKALKPGINGIPKKLFENAIGIIIASGVQVGFIFSGSTGSGIVMKKTDTGWSPPCAVGMTGMGFGLLLGVSVRDIIIFVYDDRTMDALSTKHGAQIGAQLELTIGPFGRVGKVTVDASKGGWGPTAAVAYSKGAFAGWSAEGAKVGAREFVNNKFYGVPTTAKDILYTPGSVTVPAYKVTMLSEIHDKLNKLQEGATAEPDAAEEAKKEAAKEVADKEDEAVKASPAVETVQEDTDA